MRLHILLLWVSSWHGSCLADKLWGGFFQREQACVLANLNLQLQRSVKQELAQ